MKEILPAVFDLLSIKLPGLTPAVALRAAPVAHAPVADFMAALTGLALPVASTRPGSERQPHAASGKDLPDDRDPIDPLLAWMPEAATPNSVAQPVLQGFLPPVPVPPGMTADVDARAPTGETAQIATPAPFPLPLPPGDTTGSNGAASAGGTVLTAMPAPLALPQDAPTADGATLRSLPVDQPKRVPAAQSGKAVETAAAAAPRASVDAFARVVPSASERPATDDITTGIDTAASAPKAVTGTVPATTKNVTESSTAQPVLSSVVVKASGPVEPVSAVATGTAMDATAVGISLPDEHTVSVAPIEVEILPGTRLGSVSPAPAPGAAPVDESAPTFESPNDPVALEMPVAVDDPGGAADGQEEPTPRLRSGPDRSAQPAIAAAPTAPPLSVLLPAAPVILAAGQAFAVALAAPAGEPMTARPAGSDPALIAAATPASDQLRTTVQAMTGADQVPLDLSRDDWTGAMIERIAAMRDSAEATDTRIRLAPENLGALEISIRRDGDRMHIHFTADIPATRQLLTDAASQLIEQANARGVKLGGTSVDSGTGGQPGSPRDHEAKQPDRPALAAPPGTETDLNERIA